jgi:hypothetical protein
MKAAVARFLLLVAAAACSSNSERASSPPPEKSPEQGSSSSKSPRSNPQSKPMTHRDHYIARLGEDYDKDASVRENPELGAGDWKFFDQVSDEPGPPGDFLNPLGVDSVGHVVSGETGSDWKLYLRDPAVPAEKVHAAYAFLSGAIPISPAGGYAQKQVSDDAQPFIQPPVLERAADGSVRFRGWYGWAPSPGKFPARVEIAVAADGATAVTTTDVKELAAKGSRR